MFGLVWATIGFWVSLIACPACHRPLPIIPYPPLICTCVSMLLYCAPLTQLVLCCYRWKVGYVLRVRSNYPFTPSPIPLSLSSLLSLKAVLHAFFPFFSFKPLVTPLILQLFCNNIYINSKNEGVEPMKTVQLFDFHFIPNCLKEF